MSKLPHRSFFFSLFVLDYIVALAFVRGGNIPERFKFDQGCESRDGDTSQPWDVVKRVGEYRNSTIAILNRG